MYDDKNELVLPTAKDLMRKYSEDVKQKNKLKVIRDIINAGENGETFCELSYDSDDINDFDYNLWKEFPDNFYDELTNKGYHVSTDPDRSKLCIWWGPYDPYKEEII